MIGTFLLGNQEGVHGSETAENCHYSEGLVLDSNQIWGDRSGQIEGDGIEQGHSREQSLKPGGQSVHFFLQTLKQIMHLCLKAIGGKPLLILFFFGGLEHIIFRNLGKLSSSNICKST